MQPGDTLYFPCTGGSTYLISSQLTISLTNGVPLSIVTVEGDPSGCVTVKDKYAGPYQQAIMLIVATPTATQIRVWAQRHL
jgi:hypothetical protein